MSDKFKLTDWIMEVAGEYIDSWVADVIAEEWMKDRERIRELESVLKAIIDYNERGYGEEYIRAIEDAKELLPNGDKK